MTDTKFTPGPWVVEDETLYGKEFGYTVPLIDFGFYEDNERHHEDAHLIAAAPDLYESGAGALDSLEFAANELRARNMIPAEGDFLLQERIDALNAALAKARGEA